MGASDAVAALTTERLDLRPIGTDDADDLYAILREPATGTFTGEAPPADVEEARKRIASWIRGPAGDDERWLNWLARSRDGRPIAVLAATVHGTSVWLAWIVTLDAQGRGFATEGARAVMNHLAADEIRTFLASIPEGHLASEGVARKLGLVLTEEMAHGERVWRLELPPR